jgi:hypothetical protein
MYSECEFVALEIKYVINMRCIILLSGARPVVPYFFIVISQTSGISESQSYIEHKKCVSRYYIEDLAETFLIRKTIEILSQIRM